MSDDRYFVFRRVDVNEGLTTTEKRQLQAIELKVARVRINRGETPALECRVVEAAVKPRGPHHAR